MIKTSYQTPELRNANDEVVQEGAFGKNTALSNSTNDGWIDYVMNNLEALHDTIGDSSPTLDGNGHVVEPANLAIGDEDGNRLKTSYLKLTGGTVSGTLNVAQNLKMQDNQENVFGGMYVPASSAPSQYLQIYGGESTSNNGSRLSLFGSGEFNIQAKNGTTAYTLVGGTDGTLKWRGNNLAYNAQCVHIDGAETIKGQKTFASEITRAGVSGTLKFVAKNTNYEKFSTPSGMNYSTALTIVDKNGDRTANIEQYFNPNGSNNLVLRAYNCYGSEASAWGQIALGQNEDGVFIATAPIPPTNSDGANIATTSWVNVKTSQYLSLNGGTLTGDVTIHRYFPVLNLKTTSVTRGTALSSPMDAGALNFCDSTNTFLSRMWDYVFPTKNSLMFRINRNVEGNYFRNLEYAYPNDGDAYFANYADNTVLLGAPSARWKQIYAASATINTSDERMKKNITSIPDEVLDAWGEIKWYQYQFNDAIEEKGENARIHTGTIAQRIKAVFEAHGLDAFRYGLLCYDEWDAEPATRDSEGNIVTPSRPAGNRYSLRYEEALCMEAAYQRRRADRLEERITRLEALLN